MDILRAADALSFFTACKFCGNISQCGFSAALTLMTVTAMSGVPGERRLLYCGNALLYGIILGIIPAASQRMRLSRRPMI